MRVFMNNIAGNFAATLGAKDRLVSVFATFIAMLVVSASGVLYPNQGQHPMLVASMGASVMLLLVIPNSPLSQPYSFVLGHVLASSVGVLCAMTIHKFYLAAACTVSLSLLLMYFFNCLHPPGGAAALVPVLTAHDRLLGFDFVLFPVLFDVAIMLLLALFLNRYVLKKEYPVSAAKKQRVDHHTKGDGPLARLGIGNEDLRGALKEFNAYLNITEEDLAKLYSNAQAKAYTRKFGEVRCKDIMTTDVKSVAYGTDLEEAWALLRYHKIKVLPVVDRVNRVIGVISLVDFLKRADLKTYEGFAEKLVGFIRKSTTLHTEKPEAVGQIMAHPAYTINENAFISAVVPLLSDKGLHHIPIVNDENRLVGMLTQSDLIAALFMGSLQTGPT